MKGAHPTGYVTARELAVWMLVAQGYVTKQIAAELGVCVAHPKETKP